MSYILDALRKAEAERERGSVPSIHAQPTFAGARPAAAPVKSRVWIVMTVLAVLLVLAIAFVAYLLFGRGTAGGDATAAGAKTGTPVATTPAAVAPPVVASPAPAVSPNTAPAPVAVVASTSSPVPTRTTPPAVATAPPARKPRPAPAPAASPPAASTAALPAPAAAPPVAAPATDERVYAIGELPDEIRRALPTLSVGGSMYSPAPANRLVIINGQVFHEGDRITPELTLQQIRTKSAVLSFRRYRYLLEF